MSDTKPSYPFFPAEEFHERVRRARALMEEAELDALLVSSKPNVVYFSGIRTINWLSNHRPLAVLVSRDPQLPVVTILPSNLVEVSEYSSWVQEIRPWGKRPGLDIAADPVTAIRLTCEELGITQGKIGLELSYGHRIGMAQQDHADLMSGLPALELVDAGPLLWQLRMIKSDREIEALRKVCDATSMAFTRAFSEMAPGMTERELAGIVMSELSIQTHEPTGFVMVRSGPSKYGMVNSEAFEKPLEHGDLVVVDIGGSYHYYWSDFMRMACIGPPSAEQRRFFDAELASQQAGVDAVRPGIPLADIYHAAYQVLIEHGMAEHLVGRMDRVGHGVGLDMHEHPSITPSSELISQPNMVLTIEPIFWDLPDHRIGNFAIEDIVVVTETGHEVLSLFPKDLYVVT